MLGRTVTGIREQWQDRSPGRLQSMVSMGTATVAVAGKEFADSHVAEEIEMSSGMGAPA